jgi:hypothetical protein
MLYNAHVSDNYYYCCLVASIWERSWSQSRIILLSSRWKMAIAMSNCPEARRSPWAFRFPLVQWLRRSASPGRGCLNSEDRQQCCAMPDGRLQHSALIVLWTLFFIKTGFIDYETLSPAQNLVLVSTLTQRLPRCQKKDEKNIKPFPCVWNGR